ncbi:MAG: helix-turn-helix transcriptional regulator [Myxococcota bacterium]
MPTDEKAALDVAGSFYDAALDPSLWPDALQKLSDFTRSYFAHVFVVESTSGLAPSFAAVSHEGPHEALAGYHGHFESIDPRRAAGENLASGTLVPDWKLVSQDEFVRGEFYNDFYAPLGLRWLACGTAYKDDAFAVYLGLTRSASAAPYSDADCQRANLILPHLARAAAVQRRFDSGPFSYGSGFEVLHRIPLGVVILNARGHAVFYNDSAASMLAEEDGLSLTAKGGLDAAVDEDSRALDDAVRRALSLRAGRSLDGGNAVAVRRPSGKRAYSVFVAPAASLDRQLRQDARAAAYAIISNPEHRIQPREALIAKLFGLTSSESEVVSRLAAGYSLSEIASNRGTTIHAVRWLLKKAMAKTDTRNQADLVGLVLSSAATIVE